MAVVATAVLLAVVIRVDALMIGPYFAASELIPGFPGFLAPLMVQQSSIRRAVARRFLYPFLCGAVLSWVGASLGVVAITGGLSGFLLIWPAFFKAPPRGVSRRDWRYGVVNLSLVAAFTGLATLGDVFVSLLLEFSDGDLGRYLAEQLLGIAFGALLTLVGTAFLLGTYSSLKERAQQRIGDHDRY